MSDIQERHNEVLRKLEEIEAQNATVGVFEFITSEKLSKASGIEETELVDILRLLQDKRMIVWDKNAGVRSRTAHILFCLLNSEQLSRTQPPQRNVADLKYIRYVKQIPRYVVDLNDASVRSKFDEILNFSDLESQSARIVSAALSALSARFPEVSQFQLRAASQALRMLANPSSDSSLVLVADTGAGKSFAYQLPLFIWILAKKMRAYLNRHKNVNCSALLVFPRTVLAEDQSEVLISLAQLVEQKVKKLQLPSDFKEFLTFRIKRDFGGTSRGELAETYGNEPDIIVTNTETLKRRLMNPVPHQVYRRGIDLVLYDEIHLYFSLHGAFVAGLNARLRTALSKPPVFVGMSATIARPEKHCQRLFALQSRPVVVTDRDDVLEKKVVEHHVILKPRPGRPALGVAIDATSCLLHNRRDGVVLTRTIPIEQRWKTISFSDSLDTTGRWTYDQNDLEFFEPTIVPPQNFSRGYPVYYRPASGPDSFGDACVSCHEGRDVLCSVCPQYLQGRCWWFSQDSGDAGSWIRIGGGTFGNLLIPNDSIRSKRLTAQEVEFEPGSNIYDLYKQNEIGRNRIRAQVDVDNLVATSVLEVGVDFKGIKEIITLGEIQSPTTYKQKAGRGAREGNITDGLFVMTVVPPLPLANFYYRHFYRLVNPTLVPLPLEPANPDSLKSHAFASVFDCLAKQGINIFNIIEIREDEAGIEAEFERALDFLRHNRPSLEEHVRQFLRNTGTTSEDIVRDAIDKALSLLVQLSESIELDGEKKKFINWIFTGSRNPQVLGSLEDKIKSDYDNLSTYVQSTAEIERRFKEALTNLQKTLEDSSSV